MKCKGKMIVGRDYAKEADKQKLKHNKEYGVYVCKYCRARHLTTKLNDQVGRSDLLYRTDNN